MANKQLPGGGFLTETSGDAQLPGGGFAEGTGAGGAAAAPFVVPQLFSLVRRLQVYPTLLGTPKTLLQAITTIAVPVADLTLTAFAPAVVRMRIIAVPVADLTLTAFAPVVSTLSSDVIINVPLSTLTLRAYAPRVLVRAPSDAAFAHWTKQNADFAVLVQLDYIYESSGEPVLGTLYMGTKFYSDDDTFPATRYRECIDGKSPLLFSRSLTGPTLGNYNSSLGSIEINNENGEYDFLLRLAIDNSEVRVYLGLLTWPFSDFRQLFSAVSVRADAPSTRRISIALKDASALLDKSIGGEILIGGTGNAAEKYRPANIGRVLQVPMDVLDSATLQYVHSDRGGDGGTALQVYDRGIEVTFTDNVDGTASLAFPPDGQVTADVLAVNADTLEHKVSDAFFQIVGDRCGFDLLGRYAGAGPTFSVGDDEDYPIGLNIPSAQNVSKTILPQVAESGNCFWTILRLGSFSFGRLQPQDIEGLGLPPVSIRKDDIDKETLRAVKVIDPTYYRIQCLVNKNWFVASDVAAGVDPDRQTVLRNEGLVFQQPSTAGTTYDAAPQLYDRSLAVSPVLPTLLSAETGAETVANEWMERQRFMYLPWLDGVAFRCGIQFFELELGDVVELTVDRFGCDDGELFQVIGIALMPVLAKMELTLVRRLEAG